MLITACYRTIYDLFIESMARLERMDVKADISKETGGGSKLAYSSNIPTIKPLAINTGIGLFIYFLLYLFLYICISVICTSPCSFVMS